MSAPYLSSLKGATVALFAHDGVASKRHETALAAAGASALVCTEADVLTTLRSLPLDGAIFDVGDQPARWPLLVIAEAELSAHTIPVFIVAAAEVPLGKLAPLGGTAIVADSDDGLLFRMAHAISQRRLLEDASERERDTGSRVRALVERLEHFERGRQSFAHDARVLLGIAVGFAANLRDQLAGPLTPLQEEHVKHVLDAIGDLGGMLDRHIENEMNESVAPRSGGAPQDLDPSTSPKEEARVRARRVLVDFGRLARETAELFGFLAGERGVDIDVSGVGEVSLWGDAVALKQVITNLVVNAIKFSPRGRRVRISLTTRAPEQMGESIIPPSPLVLRQRAELVVADEGPGVPVEERERIFERGTRLARDLATPGTGIGLAVVRAAVEAHRGEVFVRDVGPNDGFAPASSSSFDGAAFVVRLPLDMRARSTSVVLVEDAAAARNLVMAISALRAEPLDDGNVARLRDLAARCAAVVVTPDRSQLSPLPPSVRSGPTGERGDRRE